MMESEQGRSLVRSKSALKKNKSRSGSLFGCTKGQQEDLSLLVDCLERQLRLKSLEVDELKKENKEWKDKFMTMVEKMGNSVILHDCNHVIYGDGGVIKAVETLDTTRLDTYIETVTKTLNKAAEDKKTLEFTARRLEEAFDNVENKMNVMESHFSDMNATLTRDFNKVAKKLTQHNLDIADQFSNLRMIFQRVQSSRTNETWGGDETRKLETGISSIRDMGGLRADLTASTLPLPARKLNNMLTEKYGTIPVQLEKLLTSSSKGYYESLRQL
ncbi:uncharacterized protein LOC117314831 [Pecten maximus]|uniref:uncharacterized protein LOC117314831 n=1 Tax=Pecten maximus TaxID=6579 RepID=UPI001457F301|nr:uncharacterized protein LOC117314831 [Pecten maximus]